MQRAGSFVVGALVTGKLSERLFRAQLSNGHELLVHATRRQSADQLDRVGPGAVVSVEVSSFDLSVGRLVFEERQE